MNEFYDEISYDGNYVKEIIFIPWNNCEISTLLTALYTWTICTFEAEFITTKLNRLLLLYYLQFTISITSICSLSIFANPNKYTFFLFNEANLLLNLRKGHAFLNNFSWYWFRC